MKPSVTLPFPSIQVIEQWFVMPEGEGCPGLHSLTCVLALRIEILRDLAHDAHHLSRCQGLEQLARSSMKYKQVSWDSVG